MGVIDDLRDADLERGTLLPPPSPVAPSSPSSSLPPNPGPQPPSVAWRIFWTVAFYAPGAALPLAARLLVIYRDEAVTEVASLVRGAAFGSLQDAAVFFQTLVFARIAVAVKDALVTSRACWRNVLVYTTVATALAFAYLWMTLACFVDLGLILSYLPRLNRAFIKMLMDSAAQFTSSFHDALSVNIVLGMVAYLVSMILWTLSVLLAKIQLPTFGLPLLCYPTSQRETPESSGVQNKYVNSAPCRKPPTIASVGVFSWALHAVLTSRTLRTVCVALMASVSALHATLALDGNGSDIVYLSNAMYALETEDILKSPRTTATKSDTLDVATRVLDFQPCVDRVIGLTESYVLADLGIHKNKYPLWRKTLGYKGPKRFEIQTRRSQPPNILLLHLESWRSREVGVIGGREIKAKYNQTVTPFFDELSTSGVLFRQHYTPSIQTSRTLMSSLFGVLPSLTDESAVNKAYSAKFRLHGIQHILKEAYKYTTMFWSAVNFGWDHWREFFQANGFDELVDEKNVVNHLSKERRESLKGDDRFSWGYHDPITFEALEGFLEARRANKTGTPLFLDAYTITSHDPFPTPPKFTPNGNYSEYLTKDNKGYVDALNYVDQHLKTFITNLRAKHLLDNTILLIEGDHGYGRMEHGNNPTISSSRVYEEAMHIPFLILSDDLLREEDKGLVVDDLSSQTDLLATIADMLGLHDFMQHGMGQSLVRVPPTPLVPKDDDVATRGVVLENPYDGATIGVRVGPDLKYVHYGSGKYFVYNLTSDPHEMHPIEEGHREKGVRDPTTEAQIHYASQVVDMAQFMYDTNGFMPPPKKSKKSTS